MIDYEICTECGFGHYHDYNGVVLCSSCGEPKNRPEPPAPAKKATTTRKRRTTDE